MPRTLCRSDKPLYLNTFPSWKGRQPFRFFIMENLLEARRESQFPTNGAGPDEDVNVFLAGLLTRFLVGDHDPRLIQGDRCLLLPPPRSWSRRQRAEYYLANANHRLLHLGLMNRGDGLRRRSVPFGMTRAEARQSDLATGAACYKLAANLMEGRGLVSPHLVDVWRKLGENFTDHVHVLGVLATRRLGLGARLAEEELLELSTDSGESKETPARPRTVDPAGMDHLLDSINRYRAKPEATRERAVWIAARRLGLDGGQILSELRRNPELPR
jgi:hypothetical protein